MFLFFQKRAKIIPGVKLEERGKTADKIVEEPNTPQTISFPTCVSVLTIMPVTPILPTESVQQWTLTKSSVSQHDLPPLLKKATSIDSWIAEFENLRSTSMSAINMPIRFRNDGSRFHPFSGDDTADCFTNGLRRCFGNDLMVVTKAKNHLVITEVCSLKLVFA